MINLDDGFEVRIAIAGIVDEKRRVSYTYQPEQRWDPRFHIRRFFGQMRRERIPVSSGVEITLSLDNGDAFIDADI